MAANRGGKLPGGLNVKRRAKGLHQELINRTEEQQDHLEALDWVNLFAMAVNEENAAGGRVVTAPDEWRSWSDSGSAGLLRPL